MRHAFQKYEIDDALERFDFARCHAWLTRAYWSEGIPRTEVEHGFRNSALVAGAYADDGQVACLRVASDRTRIGYLMDVFVDEAHRGRGLGKALVAFALEHPDLRLVTKWFLGTADAHELYRKLGFSELRDPSRWMTMLRWRPWMPERDPNGS